MKKSYNPFKMWGSWVGAIILPFVLFFLAIKLCGLSESTCNTPQDGLRYYLALPLRLYGNFLDYATSSFTPTIADKIVLGSIVIVCFLLGWGIHSLIRKLRK